MPCIHLLWDEFVTDGFAGIGNGVEPVVKRYYDSQAKAEKNEGLFADGLGVRIVFAGYYVRSMTLIGCYVGKTYFGELPDKPYGAFLVLSASQLFPCNERQPKNPFLFPLHKINTYGWSALYLFSC